jgi:hypothetical protein
MNTLFGEFEELKPKPKIKRVVNFTPDDLEKRLETMESSEGSYLDIIATYIRKKPVTITNSKQLSMVISRFSRIAKSAEYAYTNQQIFDAIKKIQADNAELKRKGQPEIDWTVETIFKQLTKK